VPEGRNLGKKQMLKRDSMNKKAPTPRVSTEGAVEGNSKNNQRSGGERKRAGTDLLPLSTSLLPFDDNKQHSLARKKGEGGNGIQGCCGVVNRRGGGDKLEEFASARGGDQRT